MGRLWRHREVALFLVTCALLAAGIAAVPPGWRAVSTGAWIAGALLGLAYSTAALGSALRRRQASVDVIAWLALAGALATGEAFAAAMIAVMLATGVLLEARAA